MTPEARRIESMDLDDLTMVNFTKTIDLDESTIHEVGAELFQLIEGRGSRRLLLNFNNVRFVSSAGVAKLIELSMKMKKEGGRLIVAKVKPQVKEAFKLLRLNKLFDIEDN